MNVIRWPGEPYVMTIGHDPTEGPDGTDLLTRTYDDGHVTMSTRPGRHRTDLRWSPEVEVQEVTC